MKRHSLHHVPFSFIRRVVIAVICAAGLLAGCNDNGSTDGVFIGSTEATRIGHVFIIVLENEDFDNSFAPKSLAPYLANTLPSHGALLKNYFGTGHVSLDNYVAMISGQGPNTMTQSDCLVYLDFLGTPPNALLDNQAVGQGCIYPTSVPNVTDQISTSGLTWRGYMEDMGNTPTREAATCGHPTVNSQDGTQTASAKDQYATRHDPFMYFHSIIDDQPFCDSHVVNIDKLDADLQSADSTPNYVFITPSLCHDGHDSPCANGEPGGLTSINGFLRTWVPKITSSEAFRNDGLLIITFDESNGPTTDSSACCGEISTPNTPVPGLTGLGGGRVGAVLLSPFIKPGTVSTVDYNHYSMLHTVEDIFGFPYLGYAGMSSQGSFGNDVFTAKLPEFPSKN